MGWKGKAAKVVGMVGVLGMLVLPAAATAGALQAVARGAGKGAARSAARAAERPASKAAARAFKRDLERDLATPARPLARNRTVFRYTTAQSARKEARTGIKPRRHMTSRGGPGRPLSPSHAEARYGLLARPQVRETVSLPKGHPVRINRAMGGAPGTGEITSTERVPPEAIKKTVPLRPAK